MRGRGKGRGRRHWSNESGPSWHGAGRMRRGDIRTALLSVLVEGPGHGYQVMETLAEKTGGAWRPSPGSVYPTLQMLEDEGLVRSTQRDDKRVYEITDAGRAEAERRVEEAGGPPWESGAGGNGRGELRRAVGQLHMAARQIAFAGDQEHVERATTIVGEARKQLYQLLATD